MMYYEFCHFFTHAVFCFYYHPMVLYDVNRPNFGPKRGKKISMPKIEFIVSPPNFQDYKFFFAQPKLLYIDHNI